jgi:tyrosine decarboxylase
MSNLFFVQLQAHSCVEKAAMISLVKMRQLDIDDEYSLRGYILDKAIRVSFE